MFRAIITRQPNFVRTFSTARPRFAGAPSAYDSRNSDVLNDAADFLDKEVNERAQTDEDSAPKMSDAAIDMQMPTTFRQFPHTSIIRPYDLSYKSRQEPIRRARTIPNVGPGRSEASRDDLFYRLNLDPLDFACTPNVLNHFITDLGKIQPRYITGLTRKNQRRIGKAVRRAKMMGVIPSFSKRLQPIFNPALYNQMQ